MAKEVYTINGQRYEVEVKEGSEGKQKLVINGQEIVLQSAKVVDNTRKDGLNVELRITASGKNVELGDTRLDFSYNGPYKEEINAVMKERVERGVATQMERIAVYQQDYNHKANAEALAAGKTINEADLLKLTADQIAGRKPLPDIKRKFPWAYASLTERAKDKVKQIWDEKAAFRVSCREHLEEQKDVWFDIMYRDGNKVIIRDQFAQNKEKLKEDVHKDLAMQEKASKSKSKMNNTKEDDGTERLLAAAERKAKSKTEKRTKQSAVHIPESYDRA